MTSFMNAAYQLIKIKIGNGLRKNEKAFNVVTESKTLRFSNNHPLPPRGFYWGQQCPWTLTPANIM